MLGIRVPKRDAEAAAVYLKAHKLMDIQHEVFGRREFIYFPVSRLGRKAAQAMKAMGAERVNEVFVARPAQKNYRAALLGELGKTEYDNAVKSYDLIGDTAVIDAGPRIAKRMASVIAGINRNVRRVVSKRGAVSGRYRTRRFVNVYGRKGFDVEYRENGITIALDIRKAFFSPRLSFERSRISGLVKDGESVVVMFAGVGPYAILIGKQHRRSEVIAMELNRYAYVYLKKNITLNRVANVVPVLGDVNKAAVRYKGYADRIVMPLPNDSYRFLGAVYRVAKRRCTVHYYAFGGKNDPYTRHLKRIREFFIKRKRGVRVLSKRIVRTYSPAEVEVVIDFLIH